LRKNDFAAAKNHADQIEPVSRRARAYRTIAITQGRAGQSDAAASWIDALPEPHLRALLHLTLTQQTMGTENQGWWRSMRL